MERISKDVDLSVLTVMSDIVILQFGMESCAPCAAITKRIDEWNTAHKEVKTWYIPLDVFPGISAEYGIFSVPTVLVYVQGKLTIRESGYFSLDSILSRTERYMEFIK